MGRSFWRAQRDGLSACRRALPSSVDSDRLWAIFTPSGRLRRLKRWRVLSNSSPHLHPDTQNEKGPPMGTLCHLARPERLLETAQRLFQPCGLRGYAAPDQNAGAFCRTAVLIFIQTPKMKKGPRWGPFVIWRARRDSNSRPLGS